MLGLYRAAPSPAPFACNAQADSDEDTGNTAAAPMLLGMVKDGGACWAMPFTGSFGVRRGADSLTRKHLPSPSGNW